jgi:hypothetical protein
MVSPLFECASEFEEGSGKHGLGSGARIDPDAFECRQDHVRFETQSTPSECVQEGFPAFAECGAGDPFDLFEFARSESRAVVRTH